MITPRLLRKQGSSFEYGDAEEVCPRPPVVAGELPGEWADKLRRHRFEPPTLTVVRNAELAGPNLAGFLSSDLLLSVGYYGRLDLWERNWPYFEFAMLAREIPAREIDCAFSMAGVWSGNYFHWLIDHLPTLEAFYEYERRTGETPLILLAAEPPKFVTDSLDLLRLRYHVDDCHHYKVKRLVVPTWPRRDGYVRPSAIRFVREELFNMGHFPDEYYYITRKNATSRRVLNEEELTDYLEPKGYATVAMEKLDIATQWRWMAEAERVIGPHGAGLANIIFADRPKVVELATPAYTNPCVWLIAAAMGWEYGLVMCDPRGKEDMEVDIQKVSEVFERL